MSTQTATLSKTTKQLNLSPDYLDIWKMFEDTHKHNCATIGDSVEACELTLTIIAQVHAPHKNDPLWNAVYYRYTWFLRKRYGIRVSKEG